MTQPPRPVELGGIHSPDVRRALEQLAQPAPPRVFTTALRPVARVMGRGAQIYDVTLSKPLWSDGTVWRDAAGTAV